jgi:hypothetical protein
MTNITVPQSLCGGRIETQEMYRSYGGSMKEICHFISAKITETGQNTEWTDRNKYSAKERKYYMKSRFKNIKEERKREGKNKVISRKYVIFTYLHRWNRNVRNCAI